MYLALLQFQTAARQARPAKSTPLDSNFEMKMARFVYENNAQILSQLTRLFCACGQPIWLILLSHVVLRSVHVFTGFEKPSAVQQRSIIPIVKGEMKLPHRRQTHTQAIMNCYVLVLYQVAM